MGNTDFSIVCNTGKDIMGNIDKNMDKIRYVLVNIIKFIFSNNNSRGNGQ